MIRNIFKKDPKILEVDEHGNVKKPNTTVKLLVITIIIAAAFLTFGGGNDDKSEEEKIVDIKESGISNEYIEQTEQRLENILKTVKRAGKVKVLVTFETHNEKVLAEDKKRESVRETEEQKNSSSSSEEQTAVLVGSGSAEQPFVVKEKLPLPCGVLVVAEGAQSETVRLEIYEAIRALYGISGHRIKVTPGKIEK